MKRIFYVLVFLLLYFCPTTEAAGGYVINSLGEEFFVRVKPHIQVDPGTNDSSKDKDTVKSVIVSHIESVNSSVDDQTADYMATCILASASNYGVDPLLVTALITQESGFNPRAVSRSGARGLVQLMPGTAQMLGVSDSFDIRESIDGGVHYLANNLKTFSYSEWQYELALAAYNAGPGAVKEYGGIPPYSETINYVKRIRSLYSSLKMRV